ncbi:putative apyrase, partial [Operophtera brumata]
MFSFDEVSPQGTVCQPAEDPCIGGFARLYTAISQAREAEPDSLLLNGGDTFQGTIWYNFLRWNVSQHFMNMLPHDAHAPMLGANVNTQLEPTMTPYIRNHVVVERRGRRIGIIGVLLRVFSAPIGQVIMEDELEAVNREAALLTAQGVDIIIVLSHIGALASQVSSDVDIIVGAHSHTLLFTGETPNGDTPASDYPTVVTQANGHQIPIVQASCYTRYLGNIKFVFDAQGKVLRTSTKHSRASLRQHVAPAGSLLSTTRCFLNSSMSLMNVEPSSGQSSAHASFASTNER